MIWEPDTCDCRIVTNRELEQPESVRCIYHRGWLLLDIYAEQRKNNTEIEKKIQSCEDQEEERMVEKLRLKVKRRKYV